MQPAANIVIMQDSGGPLPDLQHWLESSGYASIYNLPLSPTALDRVSELQPDLVLLPVSTTGKTQAVDLGRSLQQRGCCVVFLAAASELAYLQQAGICDPFSLLRLPVDGPGLCAHLDMVLVKNDLERRANDTDARFRNLEQYRCLFEDSPVSLWLEDFSAAKERLDQLKQQGVTDLRAYLTEHQEVLAECRKMLRVIDINQATLKLCRAKSKEDVLNHLDIIFDDRVMNLMLEEMVAIGEGKIAFDGEGINRDLEGNYVDIQISWSVSQGMENNYTNVIVSILDITTRKRREDVMKVISTVSAGLREAQSRSEMLPAILDQVSRRLHSPSTALIINEIATGRILVELATGEWAPATGRILNHRASISEAIFQFGRPYINPDTRTEPLFALGDLTNRDRAVVAMPLVVQKKVIGALWVGRSNHYDAAEIDLLVAIAEIVANAIHRATLHEQTLRYAEEVTIISAIGRALASTLDPQDIYARITEGVNQLMPDLAGLYISMVDHERREVHFVYGLQDGKPLDFRGMAPVSLDSPALGSQGDVIRTRQPLIINDLQTRRREVKTGILTGSAVLSTRSGIYVPMLSQGEIQGVMYVQSYKSNRFSQTDAEMLTLVANTAAIAVQNARLFAATERRLQRLTVLHAIDVAVSSSLDLRVTFNILLDELIALLHLDAADILMIDTAYQTLDYATGRGFRSSEMSRARLKLGEGLPGWAAIENAIAVIPDLTQSTISDRRLPLMLTEGFTAYSAAPLISKGQVKGVLEIFYRSPAEFDPEWHEFMETLAGQVAVAIDNSTLVHQLQRTNLELTLAYDRTLEGWSRALDLRDRVTENHTRRVTELSVQLSKAMGLSETEIVHIRRGALLHDIGKLGIPDAILGKSGPLEPDERKEMEKHPDYANEMLQSIDFLAPARVIPYCHHERWDGTGYPRRLKGEQIPLPARIFAVIDVWDSLCSDRPYRKAWPPEKARDYIRANSGSHFDPSVVDAFFKIIG